MTLTHRPQRSAPVRERGYLMWSILDGAATLRIPWDDVTGGGPMTAEQRDSMLSRLDHFERELGTRTDGGDLPPLPTPNAKVVRVDNSEFYEELAHRLMAHKIRHGSRGVQ